MISVKARLFDGKSSVMREVYLSRVSLDETEGLSIKGLDLDLNYPLDQVRVSARVANTPRMLYLPNGAQCETNDNDGVDNLFHTSGKWATSRLLHHWESKYSYAVAAVVLTILSIWAFIDFGIPALAKQVAYQVPPSTEKMLGAETLASLDKLFFRPSGLPINRRQQIQARFKDITQSFNGTRHYRLEFRASPKVGANALALPSGIIVMTDELIALAGRDEELVAVLAHEVGHVLHRHTLRYMLQSSASALLIAAITGDIFSVTASAATLPILLTNSKYSRNFETEADDFAMAYLQARNIDIAHFATILSRMEEKADKGGQVPGFLSSHPTTPERLKRFREQSAASK